MGLILTPSPSTSQHAISTKEVLALFHDHKEELYDAFHTYAPHTSPAELDDCDFSEGMMTLHDFGCLVEHARMIGRTRDDGSDDLTLKEVRQAFAAAQMEPLFGDDHSHQPKAAADEETKSSAGAANNLR